MTGSSRPLIAILDSSVDVTGALNAARREAVLLGDKARFLLILPSNGQVPASHLQEFEEVLFLPFPALKRNARAMLAYVPSLLRAARRLAAELNRRDCAAIQVNDFYLVQGVLAKLFGFKRPIVTWVRMDPDAYGRVLGRGLLALAGAGSTYVVAVSRMIAALLPARFDAKVLYDPAPSPGSISTSAEAGQFVLIGNYIEGKGQDVAIRAFAAIAEDFPKARLVFHGSDMGLERNRAYRARLVALATQMGVAERTVFGEFLAEPAAALRPALAALCLSSRESFSLVTQEASALGLPVIATRCGGPEEIVEHGRTGWLVPVGDADAVAAAMRQALADPARAERMGRSGASLMGERFGPEQFRQRAAALFGL